MNGHWSSRFDHLEALTSARGMFEHADGLTPRREHGYCVDDHARLLVVMSHEADELLTARLSRVALTVCLSALEPDGRSRNRMDQHGVWTDRAETNDAWGRNVWGLGVASTHHHDALVRAAARTGFDLASRQRSSHPRAMAFAALGAAAVYARDTSHEPARSLLSSFASQFISKGTAEWPWPEARLTYANATLAEATILAGAALHRADVQDRGLAMLDWLLERETVGGHLSVTGAHGSGPSDPRPQFDQQPIEVAAMADACWTASSITGDRRWERGIVLAGRWFEGDNDTGSVMFDTVTGGSYDGLQPVGVNTNEGAESSLAFISTCQRVRQLEEVTA
jgi:hypothetical protein